LITIHYDFTDGSEISYVEGIERGDDFTTNCTNFFNTYVKTDVVVIDKLGRCITKSELLSNQGFCYIDKFIKPEHNIEKMLLANRLMWKQPTQSLF